MPPGPVQSPMPEIVLLPQRRAYSCLSLKMLFMSHSLHILENGALALAPCTFRGLPELLFSVYTPKMVLSPQRRAYSSLSRKMLIM